MTAIEPCRTYAEGILDAFDYLLSRYQNVFVIGQGVWSPWYVGSSMTGLEKKFGKHRVIDTPVSELACTGIGVGASLCGYRPIVIHPRMDFMILAADQLVNQAAKWNHMLGGQASPAVTIRSIINRGGEQGAQHSQALHSWFAHVPGLRVVMPATALDARDLLIASVLCNDPVLYIDDRWLYGREAAFPKVLEIPLEEFGPKRRRVGGDVTLVGASHSEWLCEQAADELAGSGIMADVIDIRVLNPFNPDLIVESVRKTGRLVAVDGGWSNSGFASEIITSVAEKIDPKMFKYSPIRITLPDAPAPTSKALEAIYYPSARNIVEKVKSMLGFTSTQIPSPKLT